jgi:hypothetical protein
VFTLEEWEEGGRAWEVEALKAVSVPLSFHPVVDDCETDNDNRRERRD